MSKLDFLSYINVLVVNSPHTKSLLAEKIGVSRSTLHRILSGEVEEAKVVYPCESCLRAWRAPL